MKKIFICFTLCLFAAFFMPASAQFTTTENVKDQPKWGLAGQKYVEYYYLPDINTYYYVPGKQFIYQSGGYWTFSSYLPKANKGYDLRGGNKVVINEPGAYRYFAEHKSKYGNAASNVAVQKEQPEKNTKRENSGKTSG
ncbi:MAG TPA: hypothetical protein VFI06_17265 [Chitinophagaceae bacterium]|nr:hypothetical protein [Chitinophagaceae bacterium]